MAEKKTTSKAEKAAQTKNANKNSSHGSAKNGSGNVKIKEHEIPVRLISSLIFLFLFIVFLVIFIKPEGAITKLVANLFNGVFGHAGFLVSIPAFLYLFIIHAFSGNRPVKMRTVCLLLFILICSAISHLFLDPEELSDGVAMLADLYSGGAKNLTGGLLGGVCAYVLELLCGNVIAFILLFIAAAVTLLGSMQITIPSIIRAVQNRPRAEWEDEKQADKPEPASLVVNHIANKRIERIEKKRQAAELERELEEERQKQESKPKLTRAEQIMTQIGSDVDDPVAAASQKSSVNMNHSDLPSMDDYDEDPVDPPKFSSIESQVPKTMPIMDMEEPKSPQPAAEQVEKIPAAEPKVEKVSAKDAAKSAELVAQEIAQAEAAEKPIYCFPPIDLLKYPEGGAADGTSEMRENSQRLNDTLASFKIEAHIINVTRGPSVTRYEVELEKGVRLNKLTTAADDIALSLGASGVRIAAVPGKISVVGIEVPNRAVTTVSLREVIDSYEFKKAKSLSSFAVGKDIGGNCIVGNIAKLPHMLIAGTTGSGKSVCMNSIIISLLYKASPDDVKLIMVDPKMVELGIYNGIPHLLIPVVTDPKKAAGSLQWAVTEMMRRYKAMSDAGVRDLESYNAIMTSQGEEFKKLPQVVVIIDELADLMLVAAKEVEESICRIAQMGRASGIHLIIATQRPSADVITGLMKANIPSRIAFAVASAMESRIILDTQGAEKLVGRGDMLYAPIGNGKPKRVQGCFVSDSEVEAVATYVKANTSTDYDQQIMEDIEKKAAQTGSKQAPATASDPEPNADEMGGDEMLPAAVDVILETGQASVSMLQRRLKLGYARAARIVDEMEEKGIVGPFQGSKPRAILVTKEQWEAMKSGQPAQLEFDDLEDADEDIL